MAVHSNL